MFRRRHVRRQRRVILLLLTAIGSVFFAISMAVAATVPNKSAGVLYGACHNIANGSILFVVWVVPACAYIDFNNATGTAGIIVAASPDSAATQRQQDDTMIDWKYGFLAPGRSVGEGTTSRA